MSTEHRDYLQLAAAAIDFELSATERERLEEHLAACHACQRRAAGLRSDARAIAALPRFVLAPAGVERLRPGRPRPVRLGLPTLRLVAVAGLIALLAMAALSVGAELVRRELDRRLVNVPTDPIPPVLEPSQSPEPRPSLTPRPALGVEWRSVGEPAEFANAAIGALAPTGTGGLVAVGCIERTAGECDAGVVWVSIDGREWSAARALPIQAGESVYRMSAVASRDRLVVGGTIERDGQFHAAFWSSVDAVTWTRAPDDPSFDSAQVVQIVETDEGLVAIGSGLFSAPAGFKAWASTDGTTWTPAASPTPVDESFPDHVVSVPGEGLLAFGPPVAVGPGGTRWWRSSGSGAWQSIAEPQGLEGATIGWIEVKQGTLVAYGHLGDPASPRVTSWQRAWTADRWIEDVAPAESTQAVHQSIGIGTGTVAIGRTAAGMAVWHRGPDGQWRVAAEILDAEPIAVVRHPLEFERLFMFVRDAQGRAVLWTGAVDWAPGEIPAPPASEEDLMTLFDRVVNDEPALRGLGIAVITTSLDTESNTIDVELSTERLDAVAMIAARHGPNVVARVGDPTGALLKARGTIVVRVTDTSGRGVEANIGAKPLFAEIPLDSVTNQTDRDGNFRFDSWYAGRWRLTTESPGFAPTSVELDLSPGAEVSVEIVLLPAP